MKQLVSKYNKTKFKFKYILIKFCSISKYKIIKQNYRNEIRKKKKIYPHMCMILKK